MRKNPDDNAAYMRNWRDKKKGQRGRAIQILGFFKNRIITGGFNVTKVEWFSENDGNSVSLVVEADVAYESGS